MSIPANVFSVESDQLTKLYFLQNILNQIRKNLSLINFGNNGVILSVRNANLFQLAAVYYKDATLWTTIAEANDLHDPEILSDIPINIIIPTRSLPSGGILTI